ncbi:MAG: DUF5615 family PIN-like protein [Acetobacteraceae bacterium]
MRLLLDMNVPLSLAASLRAEGHDAVHLHERGSGRLLDHEVFALAIAEARIVITSDLDFGEVLGLVGGQGCGVALMRLRLIRVAHMRERLRVTLREAGPALLAGAIVLIEDSRLRVRLPPS